MQASSGDKPIGTSHFRIPGYSVSVLLWEILVDLDKKNFRAFNDSSSSSGSIQQFLT